MDLIIILLILAVPIFFFVRHFVKKYIANSKNEILWTFLGTVVVTPIVYIGLIITIISAISYYPSKDFDKEKWHNNIEKRYEMTKDLIKDKILIGKSCEEVIELLGNEDGRNLNCDSILTYNVGIRPQFIAIDPDIIEIYFENGIVVKVEQHGT